MKQRIAVLIAATMLGNCGVAGAYETVKGTLEQASKILRTRPEAGFASASGSNLNRAGAMDKLDEAYTQMLARCEGRMGTLQSTLKKQMARSEYIAIAGGLVGVIGTIATCPHCAALASGIAGIANPLQQTFKDNTDTPADTRVRLKGLSDRIDTDFKAYLEFPAALISSGTDSEFETNFTKRLNALRALDAACMFYTGEANTAKAAQ